MALVSLWTPLAFDRIAERWFSTPNIYYLWPVPLITALTAFAMWRWLEQGRDMPPFLAAIALFLFGYAGIVISVFPYLVPPSLTIWDTAAAPASQRFMLVGTLALLPIILGYVVFVYWIFRGKVRARRGLPSLSSLVSQRGDTDECPTFPSPPFPPAALALSAPSRRGRADHAPNHSAAPASARRPDARTPAARPARARESAP